VSGFRVRGLTAGLLVVAWGCSSPLSPSTQVSGAWLGSSTLASVSGGECIGATLQPAVGSARDVFTTALRQTGSTLEATIASAANGTSCAFAGALDGAAATMTLTSCQTDRFTGARCSNGETRDVQLISSSISASVRAGASSSGTETSTWNVYAPGTATPLGTLTIVGRFAWAFLGLPSSDYHVFTGTIFPGYADGTISIEGTDIFCQPCGWFSH